MAAEGKELVEEAFRLIQKGNEEKDSWKSADNFLKARNVLDQLASKPASTEQETKIASLFALQAQEYFHRARISLIEAMKKEHDNEEESGDDVTHSFTSLSEEDCHQRVELFARLFAPLAVQEKEETPAKEHELSLEDRLNELNASLPSGFKTDDERLRSLNRSLGRLGLSLYSAADQPKPFGLGDTSKSESEQVAEIIAQAKDEVALLGNNAVENTDVVDVEDEQQSLLLEEDEDSSIDLDEGDEANLTAEVCNDMQTKVVAAQASLAELVALLDVDRDGDAEIQFAQARGKKLLKDARLQLLQVSKKWAECH
jgi:hypothetical protein